MSWIIVGKFSFGVTYIDGSMAMSRCKLISEYIRSSFDNTNENI
jgi:hypothetical protein